MMAADWSHRLSPSLEDIERLAGDAHARLPERFRRLCEGLVIKVTDQTRPEQPRVATRELEFHVTSMSARVP